MARDNEGKSERLHMFISPKEIEKIEDWRFKNRVQSKSEAIRRLCQIGLAYDRDGLAMLNRSTRALKVTLAALDRIEKLPDEASKTARQYLLTVLDEQLATNRAALSTLTAASVYEDGADTSEMDELIKRAEGYAETLVNREPKK
ncbi:hypothetical protein NKH81_20335 [Mesorhizobium sp. M0959]|uniref:hypothetical protein n=1 Tax=Mesorhizobium sp. M0959 TaxID=2957034 RepID=UPI003339010C